MSKTTASDLARSLQDSVSNHGANVLLRRGGGHGGSGYGVRGQSFSQVQDITGAVMESGDNHVDGSGVDL